MDGSAHAELSALSTPPSVCTNGSYLHVSTTDYWGLARGGGVWEQRAEVEEEEEAGREFGNMADLR